MADSSQWFEGFRLLDVCNIPTKYVSSSSRLIPCSWSLWFAPVSASRKVTKALLNSFGATGAEDMATSTAEVVAFVDEEALLAETCIVSCSFPVPCDDEDVDAVASCVGIVVVSFSWPESLTGEPFEAALASRRL